MKLAVAMLGLALCPTGQDNPMTNAAIEFLDTLTPAQKGQAVLPSDSSERTNWTYVPADRRGVAWDELTAAQRAKAHALLKASLSEGGYATIEAIRTLETVLAEMENGNPGRNPEKYWFVFFGEPHAEKPWLWRYEGHHVSLSFALKDGKVVASTPQFLGSNPAEVPSGPRKGERPLAATQDLAYDLVESLTEAQRAKAILGDIAPPEIVTASSRKAAIEGKHGLPLSAMDKTQREMLMALLRVHAQIQAPDELKRRMAAVTKEQDTLVFAWIGPVERGHGHYYRIQGDTFVVEYDNTQNDANHIHTVWRDFDGDFGGDALAEHYAHRHR